MRVVIDTNVAVSGLLWQGPPNQILKWAKDGLLRILACEDGGSAGRTERGCHKGVFQMGALPRHTIHVWCFEKFGRIEKTHKVVSVII